MKTMYFFLLVLLCSVSAFGQSVQAEKDILNKALKDGDLSVDEVKERARMLRDVEGIYPVLPFDSVSGDMGVTKVILFQGITQAQGFKRAKEWAALRFGDIDAALHYEDAESGKLIFKGHTKVLYSASFKNFWGNVKSFPDRRQLFFTLIVTMKNGKAKMEFRELRFKHTIEGYVSPITNQYVPRQDFEYPLDAAFPLALTDPGGWKGTIDLLNRTMAGLNAFPLDLEKYIRDLIKDYDF